MTFVAVAPVSATRARQTLRQLATVALFAMCRHSAHADTRFNFLAASEFGRGLGAGFEIGGRDKFVSGIGSTFGVGYSKAAGFIGDLSPGVAIGYRRYLGDWFLGPSLAFNITRAVSTREHDHADEEGSLLLDLGYRWRWQTHGKWQTRLGLSPGIAASMQGPVRFAGALTISFGVGI
jgi:hypothetical protein